MKNKFSLLTLVLLFTMGIGQMWGAKFTYDFEGASPLNDWTIVKGTSDYVVAIQPTGSTISSIVDPGSAYMYYSITSASGATKEITLTSKQSFANISNITLKETCTDNSKPSITIRIVDGDGKTLYTVLNAGGHYASFDNPGTKKWSSATSFDLSTATSGYVQIYLNSSSTNKQGGFDDIQITYSPAEDTTAPTLSSSLPANNATDVEVSGSIALTFSENVTINDASKFTLSGGAGSLTTANFSASGAVVTLPYANLANNEEYTLSIAANAVKDGSNNMNTDYSVKFTTVAASSGGGEDPEPTCPTSGVIFSADVKVNSNQSFGASSTTKISSTQADVTGGKIYAINEQTSDKNLIAPQSSVGYFCHTNNNTYFKIELECALAEGDRMTAKGYGGTKDKDPNNKGIWVSTATSRPSSAPAADGTSATAELINPILDYTVTSTDEYVGKKTIYVYRAAGASTYFDEFTITRPYAITFSSTKGSAPSATTGFEVALTQITGVSGWNHTGWTANKAVKVGTTDYAVGDEIPASATAKLSDDTQFTAVWEANVTKHTVTYYDGTTELGTELVVENGNPTASEIVVPRKLGYTFGGWSTTEDGAAVALNTISVTADMPLYAVWNAVNCATKSGTIYTMSIAVAPLANCTITSTTGTHDLYQYEGVSGGEALLGNKGTSNNCILQTNKKILLKDDNSYIKLDFDCPLKEGDKIVYSVESNNPVVSTGNSKPSTPLATLDRSKTEFVIPAESGLIDAQTIYIWRGGGNTTVTYINIVRPAKFEVTFNMHGHGTQVEPQNILEGGKVTEPATASITGWDFGGWYQTYVESPESYSDAWDFENDVVSAATELHAKWTEHVLSSNADLSDLTVNGVTVSGFAAATTGYNVELPMGTTAVPTVAGVKADINAKSVVVSELLALPGSVTVTITAENNATKTYTINFSVATSKDIELVWDKTKKRCDDTTPTANVKSDDASVSAYINKITFTGGGAEGSSLNVGNGVGNMFTLTAKAGYAFQAMTFFGKIQDATCEYSLDGGAWTELASTKTDGDKCYANIFSAAEVHEFRLRSTGNSGVWIRNMQLTIVEACTPIVVAWDEEPVEFEVGKAGYAIAATANNGGEVAYSSNATGIVDVNASTGVLTIAGLGSATLKAATAEGDGTAYCENGGNPIEISKVVNTYYLVQFDAQNETSVDEVKYYSGDAAIALPATPSYAGFDFQGWFDAATGGNPIAWPLTPSASMTVYAQWVAQCAGPSIDVQPASANYLTGRAATALVCEATAGAVGALTYTWYSCDDLEKTNPVVATATPSTEVAGTFYYFCAVQEEGCDVIAKSNVVTITVADKDKICIIKSTPTSGTTADVDGVYQGSAYFKGRAADHKLNSSLDYVGVALASGYTFQSGDEVRLNQVAAVSGSDVSKIYLYKEVPTGENLIVTINNSAVQGDNVFAMPSEFYGESTLYVGRKDANCNPTVGYLAVYRACAPILNKITVNGVEGAPVANVVTMDVPASTTQSQLEAIAYDWISNNDEWTAAHTPVATNAWEFGVANTVTFTDKDGDESVYTITVNKAAASTNIELATLTVNGNAVTVVPGQYTYAYELPYGTSAVPAVVATAADANANVGAVTANINSATFTVTAEDGTTAQLYTINFSVSKWAEVVIWDGSTMTAVATSPDATTGFAWSVNGFSSITNYNATCGTKAYTKTLPSGGSASASRNIAFTVPAGYVAKFYIAFGTHSDGNNRGMFIGTTATKTLDETSVLTLYSDSRTNLTDGTSEIVGAGTYYLNPMESEDFYEIRAYLRKGMVRNSMLGNGVLGTSCVDHNVAIEDIQGATFYELIGRDYSNYGKLAFDEIVSDELEAGVPYLFQAHGDRMVLFYGDTKVDEPVDKHNGMYGTFEQIELPNATLGIENLDDVYYFAQRALWSCEGAVTLTIPANRAYVKLSEIGEVPSSVPAPGRRRVTMAVNGEKVATGFENLNVGEKPMKIMIDGQIYILRGEKVFDATGRLVK